MKTQQSKTSETHEAVLRGKCIAQAPTFKIIRKSINEWLNEVTQEFGEIRTNQIQIQ